MAVPVLLALGGADFESDVVLALQAGRREVSIARRCVDVTDLLAAAATGQARAALVSPVTPHLDADLVAALRSRRVEPVGVVGSTTDAEEHRLHQIGVRTVLRADHDGLAVAVLDALERVGVDRLPTDPAAEPGERPGQQPGQRPGEQAASEPGRLIAVWGPTGAPGRSTIALNMAAEAAATGTPTLLIDADVYGGSLAQMLALMDESSGVLAAARSARRGMLEPAALARHARTLDGGLRLLSGLPRADRWPELSEATVDGLLVAARALSSCVVVDCGFSIESDEALTFDTAAPRRNGATIQVLGAADDILVVGSVDPVGLARLARAVLDLCDAIPEARPYLVLNRWRSGLGWSRDEVVAVVRRLTGVANLTVLPEERATCDSCLLHGRTLVESAPRSRLRAAIKEMAARHLPSPLPGSTG
jgi:MinD-like ATPase involved in chromosome partitioning or flagellar assembly